MSTDAQMPDCDDLAVTAEYDVANGMWAKALPDDVLVEISLALTGDNIKDSCAYIVRAEMNARGLLLH